MKIQSLLPLALVALAPLSAGADQLLVKFDGGIGAIPVSAGVGTAATAATAATGTIGREEDGGTPQPAILPMPV